jgi:ribA/ribD-fused uncharacterized protein
MITEFKGEARFLSNFYPAPVTVSAPWCTWQPGVCWPTTEHAFQAAKTWQLREVKEIYEAPRPGDAKRLGGMVTLREDWDYIKKRVMWDLNWEKFSRHAPLRALLLATGDELLAEGNSWHDNYWGQCSCPSCACGPHAPGTNYLGKILMSIRDLLRVD